MSIEWHKPGERVFQTGVDRGVLYVHDSAPGVAWNGLIAVTDKVTGGVAEAYYYDGDKYLEMPQPSWFAATVQAYTYPDEFEACLGESAIDNGVIVSNQMPRPFDMTYRSLIGNDLDGVDHGYKLHLIYQALTAPGDVAYSTLDNGISAATMSWDLTTTPVAIAGKRPSAHITLDSRRMNPSVLDAIEDVLYGVTEPARMVYPDEIIMIGLNRSVIVLESPTSPLPGYAEPGDVFFVKSDEGVYSWSEPSSETRPVYVIENYDSSQVPATAHSGDLVYDQTSGVLYQLGD